MAYVLVRCNTRNSRRTSTRPPTCKLLNSPATHPVRVCSAAGTVYFVLYPVYLQRCTLCKQRSSYAEKTHEVENYSRSGTETRDGKVYECSDTRPARVDVSPRGLRTANRTIACNRTNIVQPVVCREVESR